MPPKAKPVRDRLLAGLIIDPDSDCVLWSGALGSKGYGSIKVAGKNLMTHRLAWELVNGPIPAGLQIDHLCRVRHCANLSHMELVTSRVNTLRGVSESAVNAAKTHCKRGHPFDSENTRFTPQGHRICRICRHESRVREASRAS
jgi:hypothetical protein